jgi:cytochrome c551
MRRLLLIAVAAALIAGACGGDPHSDVTKARDASSVAAGATIWAAACAQCHGDNLQGGSGPGLVDAELGHPDSDFIDVVTNGKGSMPALGGELTAEEIVQVVDYVRSVQAANLD